ncbi:MAG: acyltransferase domain-containing protein [Actinobacteria bacterium]|uniref:[acyl-carrier-protein] S-malonyltransferase n=1 Tax=freshwater metagenome TaxID=449393 RepID=A0A6J6NS61_9ZZZZ|nr:acyltransferase domain-containing protein [Actinomycetota bacterium]
MIAIVCPGQGAQTPGFFSPWLEIEMFKQTIERLADASGVDLLKHGTVSDADTIRDTAIAQPLIVSAGIASAAVLFNSPSLPGSSSLAAAGHSVGEITAAAVSGVLSDEDAIKFVTKRGNAMASAAALQPTSMAAVVGGDETVVLEKLESLGLEPANFNGGGQIVAAGTAEAIEQLKQDAPAGSRVIALQVAGAFHTRFMQPAVDVLSQYAQTLTPQDPSMKLFTNATGELEPSGKNFVELMVRQVSNPVRWDLCMASMLKQCVTAIIELSPAGTLTGLAKRSMPGVELLAVKTPENIEAALSLINNHG